MACSGENCSSEHIVNVKYNLCGNCNSIRLTGKSVSERQAESSKKFRDKQIEKGRDNKVSVSSLQTKIKRVNDRGLFVRVPDDQPVIKKVYKPIKQQTGKEAGIKSKLSAVKMEIELDAVQNNEYYCCGCGISYPGLDKSHILSVGQYKRLELVKENIQLMCRTDHIIWESGEIDQQMNLNCFVENIIFIYSQDREAYQKFITRIETLLENMAWTESEQFNKYSEIYHSIISKCG